MASGGAITANAKGYQASSGPGAGAANWGGGHGGIGGAYRHGSGGPAGGIYGDEFMLIEPGSGGGGASAHTAGGAIWIEVSGYATIDGVISANGEWLAGPAQYNAGGSGGSVYMWVRRAIDGAGSITAVGGGQNNTIGPWGYDAGGGGGRISLTYVDWLVDPGFLVFASEGDVLEGTRGEPGTIYVNVIPEPTTLVLLAAGGLFMLRRRRR